MTVTKNVCSDMHAAWRYPSGRRRYYTFAVALPYDIIAVGPQCRMCHLDKEQTEGRILDNAHEMRKMAQLSRD